VAMHKLKLPISIEREGNWFIAICEPFNVVSQGESEESAIENLKEALELFLNDEDVLRQYSTRIKKFVVPEKEQYVSVEIHDWQDTAPIRSGSL